MGFSPESGTFHSSRRGGPDGGGRSLPGRGPLCAGSTRRGSSGEERCLGHADRSGRTRGMGPVPARRPAPLLFNRRCGPLFPLLSHGLSGFFLGARRRAGRGRLSEGQPGRIHARAPGRWGEGTALPDPGPVAGEHRPGAGSGTACRLALYPVRPAPDSGDSRPGEGTDCPRRAEGSVSGSGEEHQPSLPPAAGQEQSPEGEGEARSNWIAGISHDVRTPLSMVLGYASELEENEALPRPEREKARIIRRQGEKLRNLINDLNLVSMLEYEMQPLKRKRIKLSALARRIVSDVLNEGLEEKYALELDVADRGAIICGDEGLLLRALNNLVHNSIRHNPEGCRILVQTAASPDQGFC